MLGRLASFSRLVLIDKRGHGLSDRSLGPGHVRGPHGRCPRRYGRRRALQAALMGISEGGPLAMLFAATHPERVSALVLQGHSPACAAHPTTRSGSTRPGSSNSPHGSNAGGVLESSGRVHTAHTGIPPRRGQHAVGHGRLRELCGNGVPDGRRAHSQLRISLIPCARRGSRLHPRAGSKSVASGAARARPPLLTGPRTIS